MNLLTVKDVAQRLKVSQGCIYTLVSQGMLPCIRVGIGRGVIRLAENDVLEFIQNARQRTRPPTPALRHIRSGA